LDEFGAGEHAQLESLGVSLSLDDLSRDPLPSLRKKT